MLACRSASCVQTGWEPRYNSIFLLAKEAMRTGRHLYYHNYVKRLSVGVGQTPTDNSSAEATTQVVATLRLRLVQRHGATRTVTQIEGITDAGPVLAFHQDVSMSVVVEQRST